MKYEELSTPMYLLHRGVDKLLKYGTDVFEMYADEVSLSFCDRNRVIAKCRLINSAKGFRELECPKNLHGERWNYYTKKLRYSDDDARATIKKIDESCNGQFIPRNPQGVAKNMFKGVT